MSTSEGQQNDAQTTTLPTYREKVHVKLWAQMGFPIIYLV